MTPLSFLWSLEIVFLIIAIIGVISEKIILRTLWLILVAALLP
ncbi:hypothetical protein Cabys_3831 [Caldithrix abyssi DSM 13497]|uniref:Uncharacterized protein n=1 Tax=Caldithrix abyssi DSM 13497 TaxID=880073 RepID=A0A1J1CF66_CALAY|nr:hypothetical protein Cabys_3831 [Caldithrix abyssi DSM 13497]